MWTVLTWDSQIHTHLCPPGAGTRGTYTPLGQARVIYFMYVSVLPECTYVHHVSAWYQERSEEDVRSLATGVTEGCEPPDVGAENPVQFSAKAIELLTAEPSIQPLSR